MAIPKLIVAETVLAMGKPGLAGALLLAAALVYGLGEVRPGAERLVQAQQRTARAEAELAKAGGAPSPAQNAQADYDAFYRTLPAAAEATRSIELIYAAAAAEQLSLAHGEYAQAEVAGTSLIRYRVALPLRGNYGQIRRFLRAAAAIPSLRLDDVSLQRQSIGDSVADARVEFSLFLTRR